MIVELSYNDKLKGFEFKFDNPKENLVVTDRILKAVKKQGSLHFNNQPGEKI